MIKDNIHRTKEGIKKRLQRDKDRVNCKFYLNRRKELHKKDPRIRMRDGARKRAIKKNLAFELYTYKDVPEIPKHCPTYKIPLFVGVGVATDNSPSLDRIDNDKGYIKGNLQIISRKANQMKSNGNFKDIEMLYKYMKKQRRKNVKL